MATELVTHGAKEQTAERTHQKGTEKVASAAIICTPGEAPGKKTAKCVGDKAVYAEVEPLHRVARGRRGDRLLEFAVIDDGDVVNVHRFMSFFLTSYNHPLMNYSLFVKA